jgi:hypothetical protein
MNEKKIKISVPNYIYETIKNDTEYFNLNKNNLCNTIFNRLTENYEQTPKKKFTDKIQFNLNKSNINKYDDLLGDQIIETDSVFFRDIFDKYCSMPRYQREKLLFKRNYEIIEDAIKNKLKVKIKYNKTTRLIEPYFFKNVKNESTNYIFAYCYKRKDYAVYKLSKIEEAFLKISQKQEKYDENYIKTMEKNFDPFLSYGQKVKVRFTKQGKELFDNILIYNRPNFLEVNGDIYTLEATEMAAKVYFRAFLKEVEIIEPVSLRIWMKKELEEALNYYL